MAIKHNLSIMQSLDDPIVGLFAEMVSATDGLYTYALLTIVFFALSFSFGKRLGDSAKGMLISAYVVSILSIILFYLGELLSIVFVHDIILSGILVIVSVGTALVFYQRSNGG